MACKWNQYLMSRGYFKQLWHYGISIHPHEDCPKPHLVWALCRQPPQDQESSSEQAHARQSGRLHQPPSELPALLASIQKRMPCAYRYPAQKLCYLIIIYLTKHSSSFAFFQELLEHAVGPQKKHRRINRAVFYRMSPNQQFPSNKGNLKTWPSSAPFTDPSHNS